MAVDYIGIDIDSHEATTMLVAYLNARYMYPDSPIEVRTTRKGFHIKICKQVSIQEDIQVRRLLGDDPERLWYSEQHLRWNMPDWTIDVLFNSKQTRYRRQYTSIIRPI